MAQHPSVTEQDRNKLISRIKQDPQFREKLKENWADAFRDAGIDPALVKNRVLDHTETSPFTGGATTAGITIHITIAAIAGEEQIQLGDAVTFDKGRTK